MTKDTRDTFHGFCAVMIFLSWVCCVLALCFHNRLLFAIGCAVMVQVIAILVVDCLERKGGAQ